MMSKSARRLSQIVSVGDGSFPFETSLMSCKCCRYGLSEVDISAATFRVRKRWLFTKVAQGALETTRTPRSYPRQASGAAKAGKRDVLRIQVLDSKAPVVTPFLSLTLSPHCDTAECVGTSMLSKIQSPELIGSFHLEFNVATLQLNLKFRLFDVGTSMLSDPTVFYRAHLLRSRIPDRLATPYLIPIQPLFCCQAEELLAKRRPDIAWSCPRVLFSKFILARPHYGTVGETDRPDSTSASQSQILLRHGEEASVTVLTFSIDTGTPRRRHKRTGRSSQLTNVPMYRSVKSQQFSALSLVPTVEEPYLQDDSSSVVNLKRD
ncbi:hypothetical protein MCOR27_000122 [Pyricularia oryzae]|uniref:Uncharacterized protein n=1 Tax=Pyricularia grisea TaxID=148305 RepID=A0ABQ8NLL1_PYRGI|nr:hypothetical protein MCOR01_006529 [Pyricularia oryzae]KAI6298963.1 hypothetical protein MCOR33_005018 [Pyricularia grisea]KAI6254378.1 hypothetical protein MCOR19_009092 [Pyricularia oryzae]KAI6269166.1 hypothetical protein MCOR26_008834 [Pyricularia oryzae]KAI6289374.1 hypothetical protein MCOR27_000122 [Pyricularia oryzae]